MSFHKITLLSLFKLLQGGMKFISVKKQNNDRKDKN